MYVDVYGDVYVYEGAWQCRGSDCPKCYGIAPRSRLNVPNLNQGGVMPVLDHERLEAYQVARKLSREIYQVTCKVPKRSGRASLLDQVFRATSSVPMNIAEGSSELTVGRKAYFYRIARSSSTELAAGLDHMVDMRLILEPDTIAAKEHIVRVVSMLYKLTASITTPESYPPLPPRL